MISREAPPVETAQSLGLHLIQIKVDATKKNKSNYLCGVVMPFAKEAAGKAFYLSRKGKRFWLSMAYDKDIRSYTNIATHAWQEPMINVQGLKKESVPKAK